jgi:hypothetical protein
VPVQFEHGWVRLNSANEQASEEANKRGTGMMEEDKVDHHVNYAKPLHRLEV